MIIINSRLFFLLDMTMPKYVCDVCCHQFTRKWNLNRHKTHLHATQQLSYQCHVCSVKFSFDYNLTRHLCSKHNKSVSTLKIKQPSTQSRHAPAVDKQQLISEPARTMQTMSTQAVQCDDIDKNINDVYNIGRCALLQYT